MRVVKWRLGPESNRGTRLCRPLHNHSATQPRVFGFATALTKKPRLVRDHDRGFLAKPQKFGAGNETRTRDPNLGKVVLYQLSYSRFEEPRILTADLDLSS